MLFIALTAAFGFGVVVGVAAFTTLHRNAHPTCPAFLPQLPAAPQPPPEREIERCTTYVDRFGVRHTIHAHIGDGRPCTPAIVPAPPPPASADEPDGAA
jgi:hypothetical protein